MIDLLLYSYACIDWSFYFFISIEAICKIIAYGLIMPPRPSTKSNKSFKIRHYKLFRFLNRLFFLFQKEKRFKNDVDDINSTTTAINEEEDATEALHFKRNHRAYLNSFGNCFDAVSIISYWADIVLMIFKYPYLSLFKSLGALRPVRLLSVLPGTAVILKSLETSWDILLAVAGLVFFFLLLFALVGLVSFQGVFSRRCYYTNGDNSRKCIPLYSKSTDYNSDFVYSYSATRGAGPVLLGLSQWINRDRCI